MKISESQKEKLVEEAKAVLERVYPAENPFVFASAVLTKAGNIFSSANYGSDSASLSLHDTQAALAHAAAHGEGDVIAIAVTSQERHAKGEFTNPCHMCKQLLFLKYWLTWAFFD
ncbi:MAG: hypothetical protein Q8P13_03180 [bacterium]|nr:hypothetical protein [bacterium]